MLVARNLEDIYDVPTALRAFARLHASHPHARLTVAGSGPRRADLERLCAELAIADAVTFTGRIENERMADLYRCADVLLNPALVDNMPNSLLEAMASGVPIVSTRVGGVPHLVEDGRTALLVPPHDPDASWLRWSNWQGPHSRCGYGRLGFEEVQRCAGRMFDRAVGRLCACSRAKF
jgi:glycosyltransferase involved in cell wall biosynthesis